VDDDVVDEVADDGDAEPRVPKRRGPKQHVHVARRATGTKALTVEDRIARAAPRDRNDVAAYWNAKKRRRCTTRGCKNWLRPDATPRTAHCTKCLKKARTRNRARDDRRRADGLCVQCPKDSVRPAVKGGRCEECRARRKENPSAGTNATRDRRKAMGMCIECGGPMGGDEIHVRCAGCRKSATDAQKEKRKTMAAEGRCLCGRKAVDRGYRCGKRCKVCRAKRRGRDKANGED
jgi:hypothetical protein